MVVYESVDATQSPLHDELRDVELDDELSIWLGERWWLSCAVAVALSGRHFSVMREKKLILFFAKFLPVCLLKSVESKGRSWAVHTPVALKVSTFLSTS